MCYYLHGMFHTSYFTSFKPGFGTFSFVYLLLLLYEMSHLLLYQFIHLSRYLLDQSFSNYNEHQNHLEGLLNIDFWAQPLQSFLRMQWSGVEEFSFLTSFQAMLVQTLLREPQYLINNRVFLLGANSITAEILKYKIVFPRMERLEFRKTVRSITIQNYQLYYFINSKIKEFYDIFQESF